MNRSARVMTLSGVLALACGAASVVGCGPGTVKSRLHYAKRALYDVLRRDGYGPA